MHRRYIYTDHQAFETAWDEACSSSGAVFVVPENKEYLLKQIRFEGPCKAAMTVQVIYIIMCVLVLLP